ncbi:MAG: phosphate ABC transporter permease PstA [Planctomycetes bacterium]|nr:phosphate ABC transporter permease PstA [Planctomycetota bacterium]
MAILLVVVMVNGLGVFWPKSVAEATFNDGAVALGEFQKDSKNNETGEEEFQFKTANRDLDPQMQDFHWYYRKNLKGEFRYPTDVIVMERMENGNFIGYIKEIKAVNVESIKGETDASRLRDAIAKTHARYESEVGTILDKTSGLADDLQNIRYAILKVKYDSEQIQLGKRSGVQAELDRLGAEMKKLVAEEERIKETSDELVKEQELYESALRKNSVIMADSAGRTKEIPLVDIVRIYQPNNMGYPAKVWHYISKVFELLTADPRESNTEGGLFPAIFGTIMLIFLMAFTSFPLGVMAGIYLREYAKDGVMVRLVRIAVNNLAGIPSIVYGIFGLGFFVYQVGGTLDSWIYPERVAAGVSTFGTGGIIWASMTLGLLTVPVVIVSVEEALGAIPMGVREGSLALGATKFQTLVRVLLPMASPGIMTGFILAMARAAGEVAPLMITGVVKLAPTLPIDWKFPFGFDRKFMHLGFHIYDIGFQSPNVEAAKPMVYITTLLLLLIVLAMTSVAIVLRNKMRKRYQIRSI